MDKATAERVKAALSKILTPKLSSSSNKERKVAKWLLAGLDDLDNFFEELLNANQIPSEI